MRYAELSRAHFVAGIGVIALLISCLFLLRLPTALVPRELNVDESLFLSQAMKFAVDPRPWIAGDVTSSGPLNSYFIAVFLVLGLKGTFVLVHILADFLVCANVFVAYLTLRHLGSEISARFGALVLVLLYGITSSANFLHYSGELLPALLINMGFYFLVRLLADNWDEHLADGAILVFLCGSTLGAAPWCKLQAAPMSVSLALFALIAIWKQGCQGEQRKWRLRALVLITGFSLTSITMLLILAKIGGLRDFWYSYIVNNLAFAGPLSFTYIFVHLVMLLSSPLLQLLFLGTAVAVYSFGNNNHLLLSARERWILAGVLIYLCSGLFAAARVTHLFGHHANFIIMPMTYVIAGVASRSVFVPSEHGRKRNRLLIGIAAIFFVATLTLYAVYVAQYIRMVGTLYGRAAPSIQGVAASKAPSEFQAKSERHDTTQATSHANWLLGSMPLHLADADERIVAVVQRIRRLRSVRTACVWGWQPGVYVLANIPPSTRYTDMNFIISRGPVQKFFMTNFLSDFREKPPDLFIDTVVPGAFPASVDWTERDGYESEPELKKYIDENYVLAEQLTLVKGEKPVRFFLRKVEPAPVSPSPQP